jgi:hypothetical protein
MYGPNPSVRMPHNMPLQTAMRQPGSGDNVPHAGPQSTTNKGVRQQTPHQSE